MRADELAELGLVIEAFGPGAVAVREVPALLGDTDVKGLVRDLLAQRARRSGDGSRCASGWRRCARRWPATAACAPAGG